MTRRFVTGVMLCAVSAWPQTPPAQNPGEISSEEAPVTFSSRVNLVSVPVVVRDSQGRALGNLQKEDFRLFDKGKLQLITKFSIEKTGTLSALPDGSIETDAGGSPRPKPVGTRAAQPIAQHFLVWLFDDVHLPLSDLVQARAAALRLLKEPLEPGTRLAVYTTSGHVSLDFTDDRDKLAQTLNEIQPVSTAVGNQEDCPPINYYQADRIVNRNDGEAFLAAVVTYVIRCSGAGSTKTEVAAAMQEGALVVRALAPRALTLGGQATEVNLGILTNLVQRMSRLPGTRSIVLVSPGFFLRDDGHDAATEVMDRALRSNVAISSLGTQGVLAITPGGNAETPVGLPIGVKQEFDRKAGFANEGIMEDLADATGGTFFHNDNDYFAGLKRLAAQPEYIYLLGFSPQELKPDGSFHTLKVNVRGVADASLQVRKGYWAPQKARNEADAEAEEAREDIKDVVFSRDEISEIPVDLQTEYFKSTDEKAELTVVANVKADGLRFRKANERNNDQVTVVSGVFDSNGNFMKGIQRVITLHLRDESLASVQSSGIVVKETFDVAPGRYIVRVVVRDTEGRTMAARSGGVEIP